MIEQEKNPKVVRAFHAVRSRLDKDQIVVVSKGAGPKLDITGNLLSRLRQHLKDAGYRVWLIRTTTAANHNAPIALSVATHASVDTFVKAQERRHEVVYASLSDVPADVEVPQTGADRRVAIGNRRARVTGLLQKGYSQVEIARQLNVSPSTVNKDLAYIAKMDEIVEPIAKEIRNCVDAGIINIIENIRSIEGIEKIFPAFDPNFIFVDQDAPKTLSYNGDTGTLAINIEIVLEVSEQD